MRGGSFLDPRCDCGLCVFLVYGVSTDPLHFLVPGFVMYLPYASACEAIKDVVVLGDSMIWVCIAYSRVERISAFHSRFLIRGFSPSGREIRFSRTPPCRFGFLQSVICCF